MNKIRCTILALGLVWVAACTLTACEYHEPEPPKDLPVTTYLQVFIDPETKCEYLVNVQGGITPRVAANGLQYGCTYDYEVSQ